MFYFFWKGKLSQWHMETFIVEKVLYNCCEQYMMSQKAKLFNDEESFQKIINCDDPKDQKALGRKIKNFNQEIWNDKARIIVYNGNFHRFSQNSKSLLFLMKTKGELVEASPYDKIWGVGLAEDHPDIQDKSKWRGANWLGEVLTKLKHDFIYGVAKPISLEKKWEDLTFWK